MNTADNNALGKLHEQQRNALDPNRLSEIAREASALGNLWLEHSWVIAECHRAASEAWQKSGNETKSQQHLAVCDYWSKKLGKNPRK